MAKVVPLSWLLDTYTLQAEKAYHSKFVITSFR